MHVSLGWREGRDLAHAHTYMRKKNFWSSSKKVICCAPWGLIHANKNFLHILSSANGAYIPRFWALRGIWEWDFSSCRQSSWSFPGCHDPQWQQSYLGKTAWLSLLWPITGAGRGRQHHGCVFGFSPCCPRGDGGGWGWAFSTHEMACSWVVQDSRVLAPSCVCHRQNPYLVLILFFWGPWEGKARTLWNGCENYQTRFSITSRVSLGKFSIEVNRGLFNGFSWAWILTLIVCLHRVWRLGFIHLNVGIWWRCLR